MNAVLKIEARTVERPSYDNTFLGWEDDWIEANSAALLAWWHADPDRVESDFEYFRKSQHDIELTRRDEFKRTLRQE